MTAVSLLAKRRRVPLGGFQHLTDVWIGAFTLWGHASLAVAEQAQPEREPCPSSILVTP